MNALSSLKCTRSTLIILGLCLVLAGPAMLLWASRVPVATSPDGNGPDALMDQKEIERISHVQLPQATLRPDAFSPFGQAFKDGPSRTRGEATGLLRMNIGDLDPKNPDALLSSMPAELRLGDKEKRASGFFVSRSPIRMRRSPAGSPLVRAGPSLNACPNGEKPSGRRVAGGSWTWEIRSIST